MQQRLDKHSSQISASGAATSIRSNETMVSAVEPKKWKEQGEMEQADVLYALLEDRYAKEFPLPENLRHPASNPAHYDDLIKEMQEAPTRSWLGGLVKSIKGSFRLT